MKEINIRLRKKILLAMILLLVLPFCSCGSSRTAAGVLSPETAIVQPGMTAAFEFTILFIDDAESDNPGTGDFTIGNSKPKRAELKRFEDAAPQVYLSSSGFKLLSAEPAASKSGIQCSIIIRAAEELLSGDSGTLKVEWAGTSAETRLKVKKDPDARIDSAGVVTDPAAIDVFVNKQRRMPADYVPEDLVRVEVPTILVFEEVNHLRRAASDALSAMFAAAEAEQGYELLARSGYRSYKTQVMLYDLNVREHGEDYASRFSAQPGTSEHQSGLAMDISSPVVNYQLEQAFGLTDEGIWTAENAHRFGFIIRYPEGKEEITGYSYEPWHLRYVGEKLAADIFRKKLTLEEYFYGMN